MHDQDQPRPTAGARSQLGQFAIVPLWLIERKPTTSALYIYALIAGRYADRDNGDAWPSVKRLAAESELSVSAVKRAKAELVELGALKVTPRYRPDGSQTSDLLTVVQTLQVGSHAATPPVADELPQEPEPREPEPRNKDISAKEETATLFETEPEGDRGSPVAAIVERVIDYWRVTMPNRSGARPTENRRKAVRARLTEGYSEQQLLAAIDGCAASAWHQGSNDTGRAYNDLTLICRNGEKVESFIQQTTVKDRYRLGTTKIDNKAAFERGQRRLVTATEETNNARG